MRERPPPPKALHSLHPASGKGDTMSPLSVYGMSLDDETRNDATENDID